MEALIAGNDEDPGCAEEALGAHRFCADVTAVEVTGLECAAYLDKTSTGASDKGNSRVAAGASEVSQIYLGPPAMTMVHDVAGRRDLRIGKDGSCSTVVWNPGRDGIRATPDLDDDGWTTTLRVEAGNVGSTAVNPDPGAGRTEDTMTEAISPGTSPAV